MKKILCILAVAVLLIGASQAKAGPITYTEEATLSGTIGATSFTGAPVTLEFVGDTSNVSCSAGFCLITVGTATVSIGGVGTTTFTDSMEAFDNQGYPAAGIALAGGAGSVLDTVDNAFITYDLMTAIGPITNTDFSRPDLSYNTALGVLNFSTPSGSVNSTFTATTPEPATLSLLGLGLAGLLLRKRKS